MSITPDVRSDALSQEADAVLVAKAVQGDHHAASALFRRHVDAIYAFAAARTGGDRAAAEDVTQEVFVEAWQHLSSFRQDGRFPAWLVGIAKRKLARRYREAAREGRARSQQVLDFLEGREAGPGQALEDAEFASAVSEALLEIRPEDRSILQMKYARTMTLKDIAARLAISPGAANSRLQRAREAFKAVLKKRDGFDA